MARKAGPPTAPAATGDIELSLTRTEALALAKIAETGLGVTDAGPDPEHQHGSAGAGEAEGPVARVSKSRITVGALISARQAPLAWPSSASFWERAASDRPRSHGERCPIS